MRHLTLQDAFFFVILIGLTIAFFNLIAPFLTDLFLLIIFIMLFKRPIAFFNRKFKNNSSRVAFATIGLIIVLMAIPITFVTYMVSHEAVNTLDMIKNHWTEIKAHLSTEYLKGFLSKVPIAGEHVDKIDFTSFDDKLESIISQITTLILNGLKNVFTNVTYVIVHFCIIMFLLYYSIVDGKQLLEKIQFLIPLNDDDEKEFYLKLERVTDALVINTFIVGLIEGTYGGILFAILGIPSPFFWGTVMVFFSIIPFVGANSVLVPAVIIEFLMGNYVKGTILLIIGVGAVLVNQHVIKNRLDGNRSGMHPALVFLSCFGGMMWMGIIGFLGGPAIAALFVTIWNQFGKRYEKTLTRFNHPNEEVKEARQL